MVSRREDVRGKGVKEYRKMRERGKMMDPVGDQRDQDRIMKREEMR